MAQRTWALALAVGLVVAGPMGLVAGGLAQPTLARAVAVARADMAQQGAAIGLPVLPAPVLAPLSASEGAALVAHRWGAALDARDARALQALPPALDHALGQAFAAYLAMDTASLARDRAGVLAARGALLDAAVALQAAGHAPVQLRIDPAIALDLDGVPSAYDVDLALVIDVGGDDVYTNNAGGNRLRMPEVEWCVSNPLGAAALIDLAGNDRYVDGHGCGVNGGGSYGAGFLLDAAGDDVYWGANDAVNGGGAREGMGFLLDAAGDDLYLAGGWGTNGGAYPGSVGALLDLAGNDRYEGTFDGVNGGSRQGSGWLHDLAGDDVYRAQGYGSINGAAALGTAMLLDEGAGHDFYEDSLGSAWDATVVPKGSYGAQIDQ